MPAKEAAKRLLGERGRQQVRRLGRLRYLAKARRAREGGWSPRTHPRGWLREVVLAPEVDTYTYDIANEDELATFLAGMLERPEANVRRALGELRDDPELTSRIARDLGWRALWLRRRPPLPGHHRSLWVATRLLRPRLVVETGVLDGLGSRVILRALERNAAEGAEGRLVSFDTMPGCGAYVPERLASRWQLVIEAVPEAFDRHLRDERVDVHLHDSVPTAEQQRVEWQWALARGARLCLSTHAWTHVHDDLAAAADDLAAGTFTDVSRDHFYPGRSVALLARRGAGTAEA